MNPPVLHDAEAASKIVRKSPSWLYQQGAAGNIPRTKIGHNVYWTDEQLAQIIQDGAQQPKQVKKPEEQPADQRRKPQPPKSAPKRQRKPAPAATAANIPVADFSVSRLYRKDGAA